MAETLQVSGLEIDEEGNATGGHIVTSEGHRIATFLGLATAARFTELEARVSKLEADCATDREPEPEPEAAESPSFEPPESDVVPAAVPPGL